MMCVPSRPPSENWWPCTALIFILKSLCCFPSQLGFFRQLRPLISLEKWRSVETQNGSQNTACKSICRTPTIVVIPKIVLLTAMIQLRFGRRCWTRPLLTPFLPVILRQVSPHRVSIPSPREGMNLPVDRKTGACFLSMKVITLQSYVTSRLFDNGATQIKKMAHDHTKCRYPSQSFRHALRRAMGETCLLQRFSTLLIAARRGCRVCWLLTSQAGSCSCCCPEFSWACVT